MYLSFSISTSRNQVFMYKIIDVQGCSLQAYSKPLNAQSERGLVKCDIATYMTLKNFRHIIGKKKKRKKKPCKNNAYRMIALLQKNRFTCICSYINVNNCIETLAVTWRGNGIQGSVIKWRRTNFEGPIVRRPQLYIVTKQYLSSKS